MQLVAADDRRVRVAVRVLTQRGRGASGKHSRSPMSCYLLLSSPPLSWLVPTRCVPSRARCLASLPPLALFLPLSLCLSASLPPRSLVVLCVRARMFLRHNLSRTWHRTSDTPSVTANRTKILLCASLTRRKCSEQFTRRTPKTTSSSPSTGNKPEEPGLKRSPDV